MANEQFREGGVVYHKATGDRCVIIKINDDGTIKVRTNKDLERDYYPQELETEEQVEAQTFAVQSENKKDWGI